MRFRVLIYVPLHEEIREFQRHFPLEEDLTEHCGFLAYTARVGDYDVIVASQDEMGVSTAHLTAARIIKDHNPHVIFCSGIGGTLTDDLMLGDVCFSQDVIDINENQKIDAGTTKYQPRPHSSNYNLDKRLALIQAHPSLTAFLKQWQDLCLANAVELATAAGGNVLDILRSPTKALRGPIVCGPVVADSKLKGRLGDINRKVAVIETEAAGIYYAVAAFPHIEVIVVRGISDAADEKKNQLETSTKHLVRKIAAFNAASFIATQLITNKFFNIALQQQQQLSLQIDNLEDDPIQALSNSIEAEIDHSLSELLPEYRAREKGYILPVPRVKENGASKPSEQLEPSELIAKTRTAIIEIPISYPDKGLPWLYAKHLFGSISSEQIILPIVIHESTLRPPLHGIVAELNKRAPGLLTNETLLPVVLITDFSFTNERKCELIFEEFKASEIHCIIIVSKVAQPYMAQIRKHGPWLSFSLCDVSFRSIVAFLTKHFGLISTEAEALAIRLSDTFRSFNLSVHPSYFAGIPKEMLARLTDANHRAELIDLAVTGFLSFLGAGDTKDINLKQRTRRLFLRDLAYQITIEKVTFTISSLINYVKKYSDDHDFGLNPNEFVQSFLTNGILNENGEIIEFSISFIHNYLLAERLGDAPIAARRYFDPVLGEIDLATFELYSEIGLSDDVKNDVIGRIENDLVNFDDVIGSSRYTQYINIPSTASYKSSGHTLINGSIKPRITAKVRRLVNYQEQVEKVAKELLDTSSTAEAKQQILDLDHAARDEAHVQEAGTRKTEANLVRASIYRNWVMSIVMLGSAAEELGADTKRSLIKTIVKMAGLITDDWIRQVSLIDIDGIRDRLLTDIASQRPKDAPNDAAAKEEKLADFIADHLEFNSLSFPFVHVSNTIFDYARNIVLYESIKNVAPDDVIQELLLSLWKFELRDGPGLDAFKVTLAKLPKDNFLRIMLAQHLVSRGYWYRGSTAGRLAFSDAANASLRPVKVRMDVSADEEPRLD